MSEEQVPTPEPEETAGEIENSPVNEATAENDAILDTEEVNKLKARKRSVPLEKPEKVQEQSRPEREESSAEVVENFDGISYEEANKKRQLLEARLDKILKKPKIKKRKDEVDLTNDEDEIIQILKSQMDFAAKKDSEIIENQSGIAINKIKLLPRVNEILSKANLAEVILDNNLLAEIRQWLEPLPDGSLPSYEIQKNLFQALLKLPINTNHLRESGIGKILIFYQKSKRIEPKIKRIADRLISDWTRPIIGASDNYRDKKFLTIDYDIAKNKNKIKSTADKIQISSEEKSIYEQQAERRNRAAAPVPTITDYKFVPKSRINKGGSSANILSAGVGSSLNKDDQFKRINSRLNYKKSSKKSGISIEGRGLQF